MSKLARVGSVATVENDKFLANQVQLLSTGALNTLVKDEKLTIKIGDQNGLNKGIFKGKSVYVHTHSQLNTEKSNEQINDGEQSMITQLKLNAETMEKLLELQKKGINIDELIGEMLNKREEEIAAEKERLAEEETKKVGVRQTTQSIENNSVTKQPSRYIPVRIKKILTKEHGTKCSIQNCEKPSQEIHHTQRFSLSHNHNPQYLAPLCRNHHQIAHSIDLKVQEKRRAH